MRKWIVCLGGEDWWYHSHAHFDIQVMKRMARHTPVLYVCSIGMRMPSLRRDRLFWTRVSRKLRSVSRVLKRVDESLWVYSPLPLPLYQQSWGRLLNRSLLRMQLRCIYTCLGIRRPLYWVNTPTAWPVVAPLDNNGVVYQRTDDYAAYTFDNFNAEYVRQIDDHLVRRADLVIHVSDELHEEASRITQNSILMPQGVDERFFDPDAAGDRPADLASLPRPIVGYVGGMDRHKFDAELVYEVANRLPEMSFALVGVPDPNVACLESVGNVHFLGPKSHGEIPAYVHHFDICMLPTAGTEWGLKCRPIKLMEYIAAGKPVVSTNTPAARKLANALEIANTPEEWRAHIAALGKVDEPKETRHAGTAAANWTWSHHAEQLRRQLSTRELL